MDTVVLNMFFFNHEIFVKFKQLRSHINVIEYLLLVNFEFKIRLSGLTSKEKNAYHTILYTELMEKRSSDKKTIA